MSTTENATSDKSQLVGATEATNKIVLHDSVPIGSMISDRYEVSALLGTNELGRIYEALDTKTWRSVSICKVRMGVFSSPDDSTSFLKSFDKVETTEALEPTTIPTSCFARIEALDATENIYLIQHELTGPTLLSRLEAATRSQRKMTESDIRSLFLALGQGLNEADNAAVHGMISPDRIFFNQGSIRIADQGVLTALAPRLRKKLLKKSSRSLYYDTQIYTGEVDRQADFFSLGKIAGYIIFDAGSTEEHSTKAAMSSEFRSTVLRYADKLTSKERDSRESVFSQFLTWLESTAQETAAVSKSAIVDDIAKTVSKDAIVGSRVFSEQTTPDYSAKDWHKRWERIDQEYSDEEKTTSQFSQKTDDSDVVQSDDRSNGEVEKTVKTIIDSGSVTSTSGMLSIDSAEQLKQDRVAQDRQQTESVNSTLIGHDLDSTDSVSPREARRKRRRSSVEVTQKRQMPQEQISRDRQSFQQRDAAENRRARRASGEIQAMPSEMDHVRRQRAMHAVSPVEVSIASDTEQASDIASLAQVDYAKPSHQTQLIATRSRSGLSDLLSDLVSWSKHNWRLVLVSALLIAVSAVAIWALRELSRTPQSSPVLPGEVR